MMIRKATSPRIVVVGSANTDFVVQVDELPNKSETVLGGKFFTARGGKGANQAVAAARLGAQVTFVARLGEDSWGQEALEAYQAEGIDTSHIRRDSGEPSGVALILIDRSGENTIAVAPGANGRLSPADVRAAQSAIQEADILLLQLEIPLETVQAAVELARQFGVRVILNPAPVKPIPNNLLQKVDLLTPNQSEALALLGGTLALDPEEAAARLAAKKGIKNLVITLGSQGVLWMENGQTKRLPAFPITPLDTTGAGDAFNGALSVALASGQPLTDAVRFASAAGALAATRPGAQPSLPSAEEVEQFLTERKVLQVNTAGVTPETPGSRNDPKLEKEKKT